MVNPDTEKQKEYKIQRLILVNVSPWFRKALTGDWQEAKQLRLEFEDVDAEVIKQFLHYLICGELRLPKYSPENELLPIRLWVFADKHLLPGLRNEAIEHLYNSLRKPDCWPIFPSTLTIAEALESCTPTSALYRFMVAILVSGVSSGPLHKEGDTFDYQIGEYSTKELKVLERFPGLMSEVLAETVLAQRQPFEFPTLSDLCVNEQ